MEIPGYDILELLGQGGFGSVYRARQLAVEREVALKVDSRILATERDRRRFMREVTAAGRLSGHPHVVAVYDAGVLPDGRPYMVMELCPHGSLADRMAERGPLPPAEVRDLGVRIADAVAAVHAMGVLHRDIKPANILVDSYGNPALADFGLAAMPQPGAESSVTREALTPAYAPPEAFQFAVPSPSGDVYSLAAALYALLSGRPPHFPPGGSLTIPELIAAHTRPVPDLPGVPPALTARLREAMSYDPQRRPTAAAFRDILRSLPLAPGQVADAGPAAYAPPHPPHHLPAPTQPPQAKERRGVSRGIVLTAAGVIAAAIVGTGVLVTTSGRGNGSTPGHAQASTPAATPVKDVFEGVPTTTENCPAATVSGAQARCTRTAECWSGMIIMNGDAGATNHSDCVAVHVYETFAIAPLPADGQTWNDNELPHNPTVKALCSSDVLLRSRFGKTLKYGADKWDIEVLPPGKAEFLQGSRIFRCIATLKGQDAITGTMFRTLH